MSVIKQGMDTMAAKHIAEGGSVKTVTIAGTSVDVCLDENGKVKEDCLPNPVVRAWFTIKNPSSFGKVIELLE